MAIDSRIIRTKKAIKSGFIFLLSEKPIDSITVKDIAEAAHVDRKTVYNYYPGVYALIEEIEDDFAKSMAQTTKFIQKYDVFTQPEEFFTMVKEDIISNLRQYKDFLNAQEDSNLLMKLTRIMENNIALCIIDSIKKKGYEPNINNVKLCATFITCGMINVCRNCMNKFEQNIDRFIRDNTNLVLYGISGVFFGIKDNL